MTVKNKLKKTVDKEIEAIKTPPHSIEAEQSVLGGIMLDNTAFETVIGKLIEGDFYSPSHQLIYKAILGLSEKNKPFDVVTLSEHLDSTGELENAGGLAYLGELAKNTPSAANIKAYADIVQERATLRKLIHVAQTIADHAFHPEGRAASELLNAAEQLIFEIAEKKRDANTTGPQPLKQLVTAALNRIDLLFQQDSPITGTPMGFSDLDAMTSGLQKGEMTVVAGRPSMGKTSFAMNVAEHVAVKSKKSILIFSMEMPAESLAMRLLSSIGRIDQHKVKTGQLKNDDWPRLTSAVGLLSEAPMFIDDMVGLSPQELRSRTRRIIREHGELGLIIIDYIQLMHIPGYREGRVGEISEISRSLKNISREFNVPVLALSQLNRGLEQRPNKRPIMSDLRESGAIEQDADNILFVYRDEVYHEDSPDKGIAEIIIGKQRNGPIGTTRLTFVGKYTRFENFTSSYSSAVEMA
ncbi:MAG: replicative DNA helicase [Gammaproteobacteria bacterium]|nr:replicative DNA helicase [Gammaproteobacteria bacterium]